MKERQWKGECKRKIKTKVLNGEKGRVRREESMPGCYFRLSPTGIQWLWGLIFTDAISAANMPGCLHHSLGRLFHK